MSLSHEFTFQERQTHYKGRAKIYLSHFQIDSSGPRTIRHTHVDRLVQLFESEGFSRFNPENFVKVSINSNVLQRALAENGQTEATLNGPLEFLNLPDDVRLHVLHGNHRLIAAIKKSMRWWVGELYSDDMDSEIAQEIREEHPNAQPYCDGDIYRHVRHYERVGDVDSELKWRGRFRKGVHHEVARMEKDFKRVKRAIDNLLPLLGLWGALKLSYLGRWLSLKCPEEILRYLGFVHQQWAFIMGDNSASLLDSDTVDELETLMPGISFHDKAVIEDKMEKRKIFRNLESNEQRMQVLGRIIRIRGRILSFHTFTRDFIYFEACMGALKPLQPIDSKETMFEGFTRSYLRHQSHVFDVQLAEDSFEPRDGDTHNAALCYQQLFLAVMRDFPALTSLLPYRDDRKVRPKESGFRLERDLNLAQLAIRLGFENDAILAINEQAGSNRYQIATEEFLHQIQPQDRYNANTETTEGLANYVSEGITNNCAIRPSPQEARLTTDLEKLPKKLRCSRPSYRNYENDRQFLFLDIILQEDISRSHATSFAVQRDIFFSFFGENYHKTQDFNEYSSADNPRVMDSQEDLFNASEESSPRVSLSTTSLQHAGGDGPAYNDSGEETEEIIYREDISAMNEASDSDDPIQVLEQHSPTRDSFETHSVSTGTNSIADDEEFTVLDQNTLPSAFIQNILSQTNDILLYIWQNRRYAQLSSSPEDKPFFDRVVKKLANRQQVFISTQGNRLPHLIMLKNLNNSAISERLILVGPKADSAGLSGTLISRIRQGNFLHFIDEGFDFEDTGI